MKVEVRVSSLASMPSLIYACIRITMKYVQKLSIFLISVCVAFETTSYNQKISKGFDAFEACGFEILQTASLEINKDGIAHGIVHVEMLKM